MVTGSKYISYLDGFRGYAILLVVFSHLALLPMDLAYFGVTLFFFISGYLITRLMISEFDSTGTIGVVDFYLRRVFRLYPALLMMLLVSLLVILLNGYQVIWTDLLAGLFYFTNYYLVYFEPVLPDKDYLLVSRILWSLSVEEHFYLLFPLLFGALYSISLRRLLTVVGILLILFLFIRIYVVFNLPDRVEVFKVTYYTTHCRADSILFGCFSALLLAGSGAGWYRRALGSHYAFVAACLLLIFSIWKNDQFLQYTFKYSFQGLALMFIVPAFSQFPKDYLLRKIVDNRLLVLIGKLSYSLYLFHWVSLKVCNIYFPGKGATWYLCNVLFTILLSLSSYHFVERPFLRFRKRFGSTAQSG